MPLCDRKSLSCQPRAFCISNPHCSLCRVRSRFHSPQLPAFLRRDATFLRQDATFLRRDATLLRHDATFLRTFATRCKFDLHQIVCDFLTVRICVGADCFDSFRSGIRHRNRIVSVMSWKYSLMFFWIATSCVVAADAASEIAGWFGIAFLYEAVTFLLLATAYAGAGPGLLLKQTSGRRSVWAWIMFGPYILLNHIAFGFYRRLSRESASVQVVPNVFFGRRLLAHECVAGGWVGILDLAAEFEEVRPLRKLSGYRSMPVLDATAPTEVQLRSAIAWIANAVASGPIYVHCALGHGRSACVVIAYLLSVGEVTTVEEGELRLRLLRPGVKLSSLQRRRLRTFEGSN